MTARSINPFYEAHHLPVTDSPRPGRPEPASPTYVRLPRAPVTASPVPDLTSLYHRDGADGWGDRRYPGNCSGHLIHDLLQFFKPSHVFDPMTGSGTCRQACDDLGIPCDTGDIRFGQDAASAEIGETRYPFVWIHPPYWRQKLYTDDPRDLSRQPTLEAFLERYEAVIRNCAAVLTPGGRLAILMGDYIDREVGFVTLTYFTKSLAFAAGLRQRCTDIIRFSHGTSSSSKVYRTSFIPGLHDVCMIFEKPRATP